ncbi:MAG: histidine phosphatase family protein [Deltaproteobacteria bacterium]|nr:histidine phosphatase family protein [Deltaproteobacteria bacterium]
MDIEGSTKCFDQNETVKVVLLRHGETEGNVKGIVQGHWDTPLTAKGIESTLRKAKKIQDLDFDAVFCSDLSRTVETLKVIQEEVSGLPEPAYTPELREINFGDLTGRPKQELMPTILKHKSELNLPYPKGESGGGFTARVKSFFTALKRRFPGGRVLAITHYGVMETAAKQFESPPSYDNIHIGADDVWLMCFAEDGSAIREVL